jgi:hypothetical protein
MFFSVECEDEDDEHNHKRSHEDDEQRSGAESVIVKDWIEPWPLERAAAAGEQRIILEALHQYNPNIQVGITKDVTATTPCSSYLCIEKKNSFVAAILALLLYIEKTKSFFPGLGFLKFCNANDNQCRGFWGCMCVCVCVRERERERENSLMVSKNLFAGYGASARCR